MVIFQRHKSRDVSHTSSVVTPLFTYACPHVPTRRERAPVVPASRVSRTGGAPVRETRLAGTTGASCGAGTAAVSLIVTSQLALVTQDCCDVTCKHITIFQITLILTFFAKMNARTVIRAFFSIILHTFPKVLYSL